MLLLPRLEWLLLLPLLRSSSWSVPSRAKFASLMMLLLRRLSMKNPSLLSRLLAKLIADSSLTMPLPMLLLLRTLAIDEKDSSKRLILFTRSMCELAIHGGRPI